MRKVRYSCAMSLDGYIAEPGGEFDWIVMDPDMDFQAASDRFVADGCLPRAGRKRRGSTRIYPDCGRAATNRANPATMSRRPSREIGSCPR